MLCLFCVFLFFVFFLLFFSIHIVKYTGKSFCDDMKIVQKDLIVPQNMVFPVSFVSSKKIDLAKRNFQKPTQTKKKSPFDFAK